MYLLVGVGGLARPSHFVCRECAAFVSTQTSRCLFSFTHRRTKQTAFVSPNTINHVQCKTKTDQNGRFVFWWEWVDSNHLSRKTTDLQSAPALQLRRTPRTFCPPLLKIRRDIGFSALAGALVKIRGASSGNRTRISSLEGLHSSP